ncbi:MAG: DNA replicative helicase MCM subunit Mcm2 (Cdc46/Mcm family) [Candidatus Poseidoniaceae archaeon]|jgi:DNA replicative helicase MCM subunit Mcm2 (Cdc46/Mcm family)
MKRKSPTEPPADSQKTLESWRLLFESDTYSNDLDALPGNSDPVFGFEVEWDDLADYDDLQVKFSENMVPTLFCGNQVLKEQYTDRNMSTRPVIRVVNLPDDRAYEVSQLRMRDRTRLLTFDGIVVSTSPIIGWLKISVHQCNDCDAKWTIDERLARPREKVKYCRLCLDIILSNMDSKKPKSFHKEPNDITMVAEENYYEDVQYLEIVSPDMLENGMAESGESFQVVVFDEYVGQFAKGDCLTINAVVAVDPLINRDFIRDTRRMIFLKAHSVEEGFSNHVDREINPSKDDSLS